MLRKWPRNQLSHLGSMMPLFTKLEDAKEYACRNYLKPVFLKTKTGRWKVIEGYDKHDIEHPGLPL